MREVVIFGGTGFIGTHLAQYLLTHQDVNRIYLVDLNPPRDAAYTATLQEGLRSGKIIYVQHDVRQPVETDKLPQGVDAIFNFAAVHREPGHEAKEYFETNLLGAENVCAWASRVSCPLMVFTSSISPYGPSEDKKTEKTLPVPETPYGSSKLAAEKIHLGWQSAADGRQLLIMRPGVVFGPGEGGNVTRLVRSLVNGFFVYTGNRETRKAAGYVKELCRVMLFGIDYLKQNQLPSLLLNFSTYPTPSMEEIVNTICVVLGIRRKPLSIPRSLLMGSAYLISNVATLLRINQPINPVRVRKMFRSTNVEAVRLQELGYVPAYTLQGAFEDWKRDLPSDFQK